jgi:hypothetical protein
MRCDTVNCAVHRLFDSRKEGKPNSWFWLPTDAFILLRMHNTYVEGKMLDMTHREYVFVLLQVPQFSFLSVLLPSPVF